MIELAGKSMISRVYEIVHQSVPNAEVVVATDDKRIVEHLAQHSIPYVLTDASHVSGTDRVAEAARQLNWDDSDIIINVQGDEPLIPNSLITEFAKFCSMVSNFSMGTITVPVETKEQLCDSNIVKVVLDENRNALMFSRSVIPFNRDTHNHEFDLSNYLRHIGIYAYRNDILQKITNTPPCRMENIEKLEQLRALWLGIDISVYESNILPQAGIDTPADVIRVSEYLESL